MRMISLLLVGLLYWPFSSIGQEYDSTGNLVNNIRGTSGHDVWLGTGAAADLGGVHPITVYGCCSSISGSSPLLDTSTLNGNGQSGQIIWSYGQTTVNYIVNTLNALPGSGLRIHGYYWGYELRNMNGDDRQSSVDTLVATSRLWNSTYTGGGLASETRTHDTKMEWTAFTSTVTLASPQSISNVGNLQLSFTSADSGFWAGYYGPQIRNVDARLLYSVDPCVIDPQSSPSCPGFKIYYNISDDGFEQINLPFVFSFYGQNFSTSYFQSNGVISFQNSGWGFCCSGPNLAQLGSDTSWNYTLLPLAVDLWATDPSSRFYTQSDNTYMRYTWENINQFGTNNLNTFSVEIRPTGYIGFTYNDITLDSNTVTAGIVGDVTKGQYKQIYHGSGENFNLSGIYSFTGTEVDQCFVDPLSSVSCPGYQQAFYDQQCAQDPLYDSGCPGFEQANLTYQCGLNTLYSTSCPGYEQANFSYQCGLNALYSTSCPGYEQANFSYQCGLNALYSTSCPGYFQAWLTQTCSSSPLADLLCPGYAEAYFAQECQKNPLYDNQCPGYGAAIVLQNKKESNDPIENMSTITGQSQITTSASLVDPNRSEANVLIDAGGVELTTTGQIELPTGQTEAARESQQESAREEENKQEEKKRPDPRAVAQARAAVEATNKLAESIAQESVQVSQLDQSISDAIGLGTGITLPGFIPVIVDRESDSKENQSGEVNRLDNRQNDQTALDLQAGNDTKSKEVPGSQPPTGPSVRRGGAVEGMEGGASMAELARAPLDFNQYLNSQLKDSRFYESREIYRGQRTVDNARAQRFLNAASDRLHQEMVDQQYGK